MPILDSIEFHGVTITKRDALVKEISELFKSKNLDELIRMTHQASDHMQQMGLFEICRPQIDLSKHSKENYAVKFLVQENKRSLKVNLKMEMRTTGDMDAGVGARKVNIFGRGETAEFTYIKGIKEWGGYNFDFTTIKPFLGWQNYDTFGAKIFKNTGYLRWNKSDIVENATTLHLNTNHLFNRLKSSLRLNLIWRLFLPRYDTAFPAREHAGHTSKISLEHILTTDTRDQPILPSTGSFYQLNTELAGLLGDCAFFKCIFDYQGAITLPFCGIIFSSSLRFAHIKNLAERSIHLLDRIYAGGPYDVRGFEQSSIGVRRENCSLGGASSFLGALHIYAPLIPKDMIFAHLFITAGSVSSVVSKKHIKELLENCRVSTGLGLVLNFMNAAKIELNYILPLYFIPGDKFSPGIQLAAGINFM